MKRGFTMISLVLYTILFFAFTAFASAISTNLNYQVLSEKGKIIVNESYMKLYTNLIDSSKKSDSVDIIMDKIIFSNGDIYEYDIDSKKVLKNSGDFVRNIEGFTVSNLEDILTFQNNVDDIDLTKSIRITVSFEKYNQEIQKDIVFTVGDEIYD